MTLYLPDPLKFTGVNTKQTKRISKLCVHNLRMTHVRIHDPTQVSLPVPVTEVPRKYTYLFKSLRCYLIFYCKGVFWYSVWE